VAVVHLAGEDQRRFLQVDWLEGRLAVQAGRDAVGDDGHRRISGQRAQQPGVRLRHGNDVVYRLADLLLQTAHTPRLDARIQGAGQAGQRGALGLIDALLQGVFGVVRVIDYRRAGLGLPDDRQVDRHLQILDLDQVEACGGQPLAELVGEGRGIEAAGQVGFPGEQQRAQPVGDAAPRRGQHLDRRAQAGQGRLRRGDGPLAVEGEQPDLMAGQPFDDPEVAHGRAGVGRVRKLGSQKQDAQDRIS